MLTIGSLFSGVGGLELGLEMAGLGPVLWQAESNEYARKVLGRHWPQAKRFSDVLEVNGGSAQRPDLICGGFPCQDISSAGKGAGLAGSRSGLWFEFLRIVTEIQPEWVVVENVASGANRWVDAVRADLERAGYEALPVPLSAQDVGAPHLRRRVFIIAHAVRGGRKERGEEGAKDRQKWERPADSSGHTNSHSQPAKPLYEEVAGLSSVAGRPPAWPPIPDVRGVDDGVPDRVDRNRCLGNAVVPQCAEVVGHMVLALASGKL